MQINPIAQKVYEYGFVLDDAILFLDTHPDDPEALAYYRKMREAYQEAYLEYVANIGPLMITDVDPEKGWSWLDDPWPWEGGMC